MNLDLDRLLDFKKGQRDKAELARMAQGFKAHPYYEIWIEQKQKQIDKLSDEIDSGKLSPEEYRGFCKAKEILLEDLKIVEKDIKKGE